MNFSRNNLSSLFILNWLIFTSLSTSVFCFVSITKNLNPRRISLVSTAATSSSPPEDSSIKIPIDIIYENKLYQIQAIKGESILSALERARASPDPNIRIPLPPIPNECRRGNCMTCSGRLLCSATRELRESNVATLPLDKAVTKTYRFSTCDDENGSLLRGEDGLNPYLSKEIQTAGFVLLCSSYVVGEGLTIEIGLKEEAWEFAYTGKMTSEKAQSIRVAAAAKSVRLAAEQNIPRWKEKTEKTLKKTPSPQ